jgi:hypothetical protein
MTMKKPYSLTLKPLAIIEVPGEARSYLKLEGGVGNATRSEWLPLAYLNRPGKVAEFIADRFGYVWEKPDELHNRVNKLKREARKVPRTVGTPRLGWTQDGETFLYGRQALPASSSVEFIAPEGTMLSEAARAVEPRGSLAAQVSGFQGLWQQSPHFRIALSLACISPLLEVIGAPPVLFHLTGPSGVGKTTVLRLALSAFADPFASVTCVDFAKDSKNYADAQLGVLHNFPILLDETTLTGSDQFAEVAYNIAVGRTKGRLGGSEKDYLPVAPMSYALVCFLSGEQSIRDKMEHAGGAARFVEFPVDEQLLPEAHLPGWNEFAKQNHGWFGIDLMSELAEPSRRERIVTMYKVGRALTTEWCKGHPRLIDFLAALQLGYRMAARRLGFDDSDKAAVAFAQEVYRGLNLRTKLDDVLGAIAAHPSAPEWAERGFIPNSSLAIAKLPSDCLPRLKAQGLATRSDSRKVKNAWGKVDPQRGIVLTPTGQERLLALIRERVEAA